MSTQITISGGGASSGQKGINVPFTLASGQIATYSMASNAFSSGNASGGNIWGTPFYPSQSITSSNLFVNITATTGGIARILIYSELNGEPYEKLFESADINVATTGVKTVITNFNFVQDTKYFLCFQCDSNPLMTFIPIGNLFSLPQRSSSQLLSWTSIRLTAAIGSAPAIWPAGFGAFTNTPVPYIGITKA